MLSREEGRKEGRKDEEVKVFFDTTYRNLAREFLFRHGVCLTWPGKNGSLHTSQNKLDVG